jgi:predicted phosphatase
MNTELIKLAKALVQQMKNIETNPDIVSVFSIARSRGYIITSPLWHKELNELDDALKAIDLENSAK